MFQKKQHLINALSLQKQPPGARVPIWELEFHLWDAFSDRRLCLGREFEALPKTRQEKVLYENVEIFIQVSEALNFSMITVPGGYWEVAPGVPAYLWLPGETRLRQIEILRRMAPDLLLTGNSGGVLAMPKSDEYMEFAVAMFEKPETIDRRAEENSATGLAMAQRLKDAGMDVIYCASDIADNSGPFFNPEQMERFILPYLTKWASAVKDMGGYAILHSDGNLNLYLDSLADSGIHALQAIDPLAGMDMRTTKDKVGDRICLCGNVDCGLMVTGTPESVYAAIRELLENNKDDGGLILGASNALEQEVPPENYLAMLDAWKEYGEY